MRCYALGCLADVVDSSADSSSCLLTCSEHQDFFRFSVWYQAFGPRVYNRRGPPAETRTLRAYIEHCLVYCVRDICAEDLQGLYLADDRRFEEFPDGEMVIAAYLLDYCKVLFRRHDVSLLWNVNLFHALVKQGILRCWPNRMNRLQEELGGLLRHPSVGVKDVLGVLARLRHSHPSPFALQCSREAWQELLEAIVVPELLGNWTGCAGVVREFGTATAVPSGLGSALEDDAKRAQWRYETEPFLLNYVDLCAAMAAQQFDTVRDELLAVALHPDRGREWLLDGEGGERW